MRDIAHYICKMGPYALKALGKDFKITDIIRLVLYDIHRDIAIGHLT